MALSSFVTNMHLADAFVYYLKPTHDCGTANAMLRATMNTRAILAIDLSG